MTGYVYLIHFDRPVAHARHYLGYTADIDKRMAMHQRGAGARLLQVCKERGITWTVAWVRIGDRNEERRLKNWHKSSQLCPICKMQSTPPPPPSAFAVGSCPFVDDTTPKETLP